MKRLSATALLVLLGIAGLTACGGDDAAVRVDGDTILTVDELETQLAELADAPDVLTALDGRGSGRETLAAGFVASVLDNHILLSVMDDLVAAEGVEPDVEGGTRILTDTLANPPQGGIPVDIEDVPDGYRQTLTDVFSGYAALIVARGGNLDDASDPVNQTVLAELGEELSAARAALDVEVAPRFGRWDTSGPRPGVAPPEGPAQPVEETELTIPAGG